MLELISYSEEETKRLAKKVAEKLKKAREKTGFTQEEDWGFRKWKDKIY